MLVKVIIRHLYVGTIHKARIFGPVAPHELTLQSIVVLARFHVWLLKFFDLGLRGFLTLLIGEYKFLRYAMGGRAARRPGGPVIAPVLLCPAQPLRTTTVVARPDPLGSHFGRHTYPERLMAQRDSGLAQPSQGRPVKLAGTAARLPFRSGGVCATLGFLQAESSNDSRFC